MSITITISAIQSHTLDVMQMRCRTVTVHRSWDGSLWATTTLADEAPRTSLYLLTDWNDLLVDSQSLCSYSVEQITVLHKYWPPLLWFLSELFLKICFKSLDISIRPLLIGPTAVTSHAAVNSDARSIQISSQNIRIRH